MASPGDDPMPDYVGPPPDPPPTGPELASSPHYGTPPRPAAWIERPAERQVEGSSPTVSDAGAGRPGPSVVRYASGEIREDDTQDDRYSDPLNLLRDDLTGTFRRMGPNLEWEGGCHLLPGRCLFTWFRRGRQEPQYLLPPAARIPAGSADAALGVCRVASPWKVLLGLAAPPFPDGLQLESDPPHRLLQPMLICRLLTCVWMLGGVVAILVSIGLQWAHCHREYFHRLRGWPAPVSNSTDQEYLCLPSFIWACLVPRLLYSFGYVAVFVCLFCLHQPDLISVVSRAYDAITEQRQYVMISKTFIDYCDGDQLRIFFWFVVVHGLSLTSGLLGEGVVTHDVIQPRLPPPLPLGCATYVFTCLVRLLVDSMIAYCLLTHSMSIKYLVLMIEKTAVHLQTLCTVNSNINACKYAFLRAGKICHIIHHSQACASAAVLLAMLRICQTISIIWLDLGSQPRRLTSLGQLPIAIVFLLMILYHIFLCIWLSCAWEDVYKITPVFMEPPHPVQPDPLQLLDVGPDRDERALALWREIVHQCPVVTGRLLGLSAGQWMYWAFAVIGALYCAGYYALLKHLPLV